MKHIFFQRDKATSTLLATHKVREKIILSAAPTISVFTEKNYYFFPFF